MYNLLSKLLEQQKNLRNLFIINVVFTGIMSALLLYFSIHVMQTASIDDTISQSLGTFFMIISLFVLGEIGATVIVYLLNIKKYKEFVYHINKFAVDNDLVHKDSLNISPSEFYDIVSNSTDEKDFENKLTNLIKK